MRKLLPLAFVPLVAACATAVPQPPKGPVAVGHPIPRPPVPIEPEVSFRAPQVRSGPGLDGVIGSDAGGLVRQFGTPRLDVWEADARKLQFAGTACVLDVFLYPLTPGRTETATWVEARRQTDGKDVDRAACVAALRR